MEALNDLLCASHAQTCIDEAHRLTRDAVTGDLRALVEVAGGRVRGRRGGGGASGGGGGIPAILVHPFGSTCSGFGQRTSDMDFVCEVREGSGIFGADLFRALSEAFHSSAGNKWGDIVVIKGARIPIIKATHSATGIPCDIQIGHLLPLHNTRLLASYCAFEPRLPLLVFALKRWVVAKRLNDAYEGTLSSYGWVLLAIFFLQRAHLLPCLQADQVLQLARRDGRLAPRVTAATVQGRLVRFLDLSPGAGEPPPLDALGEHVREGRAGAAAAAAAAAAEAPGGGAAATGSPGAGSEEGAFFLRLFGGAEGWREGKASPAQLLLGFFAYFTRVAPADGPASSIRTGGFLPRATFAQAAAAAAVGEAAGGGGGGGGGGNRAAVVRRRREKPTPAWGLATEDPFELEHNLGRNLKLEGHLRIVHGLKQARELLAPLGELPAVDAAASSWAVLTAPTSREEVRKLEHRLKRDARAQAGGGGGVGGSSSSGGSSSPSPSGSGEGGGGGGGGASALPSLCKCTACGEEKEASAFSNAQRSLVDMACRVCVERRVEQRAQDKLLRRKEEAQLRKAAREAEAAAEAGASSQCQACLQIKLNALFSKTMRQRGRGERRCMECVSAGKRVAGKDDPLAAQGGASPGGNGSGGEGGGGGGGGGGSGGGGSGALPVQPPPPGQPSRATAQEASHAATQCMACNLSLPLPSFSKNQLSRKAGERRCKACVDKLLLAAQARAGGKLRAPAAGGGGLIVGEES